MKNRWIAMVIFGIGVSGYGENRQPNPIIRHMFTADPSAHVWKDGRLYLYPSTDVAPPRGCDRMDGYHVFSTDDMVNWVDHGEILHSRDVKWGRPEGGFMWAPDCAYKDGTYYYYFPHPSESNWKTSWKIGVATSTNPTSGFVDRGYLPGVESLIDPCVFMDEDGQAYFYQGGSQRCVGGRLADTMMEIEGPLQEMVGLDEFHEGAWVFKRKGIYYMIYPDNEQPCNFMRYAMSNHPLGPWEHKGVCMTATDSDTMHGSVVEFRGQWYIFYHSAALSGGITNLRSVCFDRLFFNEDGTIQRVEKTLPVRPEIPSSGNLLRNPSFEEGFGFFIYAWKTSTTNITRFAGHAAEGDHVLSYTGAGVEPVTQKLLLTKNTQYQLDVWMKIEPGSKGSVIFDTSDQFDDTCQFVVGAEQSGQWIHKTGRFNSGEKEKVTVRCFTSEEFSGTCSWDNLSLRVIP